MPITRSFTNNFSNVDLTQEINIIPDNYTVLGEAGLFEEEFITTSTATFEEIDGSIAYLTDQIRGSKQQANRDDLRRIHAYPTAHVPFIDQVTALELDGKRAYGSQDFDTETAVISRKLERMVKSHVAALELARWRTLTTGTVWAPNNTISGNFFTDFNVTRTSVDFALGTAGTEIVIRNSDAIRACQDNLLTGSDVTDFVMYASRGFFDRYITHPKVTQAYNTYASVYEPLRNSMRTGKGKTREFRHAGILLIEVPWQGRDGQPLIPANEAVMVPLGTEGLFKTFFSPAQKFSTVNTIAERRYAWQYTDNAQESIKIETESNFINVLARPASVIRCFSSN